MARRGLKCTAKWYEFIFSFLGILSPIESTYRFYSDAILFHPFSPLGLLWMERQVRIKREEVLDVVGDEGFQI